MVQKSEHSQRSSCPLACALDVLGDHWSLLVIRDLMFLGRHEYKDMLNAEEGISSNILSDRLKRLEDDGVIDSIPHPESGRRKLYYLLPKGKDLIHALIHLARWSDKHLGNIVQIPAEKRKVLINHRDADSNHATAIGRLGEPVFKEEKEKVNPFAMQKAVTWRFASPERSLI